MHFHWYSGETNRISIGECRCGRRKPMAMWNDPHHGPVVRGGVMTSIVRSYSDAEYCADYNKQFDKQQ